MSLTTAVATIKSFVKYNTTEENAVIGQFLQMVYQDITRRFPWKQLIVRNTQQALTAGTETYSLPDGFYKMLPDSMRIYDRTYTTQDGTLIPFVNKDQIALYGSMADMARPIAWSLGKDVTGSIPVLVFMPQWTQTGLYAYYDYQRTAPPYSDSDDDPNVTDLEDYLVYETVRRLALRDKDFETANQYARLSRDAFMAAFNAIVQE